MARALTPSRRLRFLQLSGQESVLVDHVAHPGSVAAEDLAEFTRQLLADGRTDLAATLNVQFGAGIVGSSALSFGVGYAAPPRVAFTIQGTLGSIELDESRRLLVSTPSGTSEESFDDDWLSTELADFVAGVRGEDRGQPTIRAGRRAVQLAELAGRSAAERRWVETEDADE